MGSRLRPKRPGECSAAESHVKNDEYMSEFERAWKETHGAEEHRISAAPSEAAAETQPQRLRPLKGHDSVSVTAEYHSAMPSTVVDSWINGPVDEVGARLDISDRPLLCSASDWKNDEVVVGCADHSLYVVDVARPIKKRQLHNKTNGHAEWVTCVAYLPNGSIISGAMDSKLCVWSGSKATNLSGHTGPISQVISDEHYDVAISASYDKSIRVWGLKGRPKASFQAHSAPILEMKGNGRGGLVSGDRSGNVKLWDLHAGECLWTMKSVHKGHVTALAWADGSGGNDAWAGCFASGGQDGVLRVWDPRALSNPAKLRLHENAEGKGALTGIILGGPCASYMAATCGADNTVRILDTRAGVGELANFSLSDFPYALYAAGGLLLAGCGDGSLHVIDMAQLLELYRLETGENAVRAIEASRDKLVCAGDDGNVAVYNFT